MADILAASRIEQLTEGNYQTWALKMAALLRTKKLYKEVIEGEEPPKVEKEKEDSPEGIKRREWEAKNDEAFSLLIMALSSAQAGMFVGQTNAQKVWKELQRIHEGNADRRAIDLSIELKNIKMGPNESVDSYFVRARSIVSRLATMGRILPDSEVAYHVIRGVHHKYESAAAVLRGQRNVNMEDAHQVLREEEMRLVEMFGSMKIKDRAYGAARTVHRPNTRGGKSVQDNGCYVCGKRGHPARLCWFRKNATPSNTQSEKRTHGTEFKGKSSTNTQSNSKDTGTKPKKGINHALGATGELPGEEMNCWTIDSGASAHMTPFYDLLQDVEEIESEVKVAEDGRVIKAIAKGKVETTVSSKEGEELTISMKDVLYVPQLTGNLLSVRQMVKNGNVIIFDEDGVKIEGQHGLNVEEAPNAHSLYVMKTNPVNMVMANMANNEAKQSDETVPETTSAKSGKVLWHRRLCHVHENYLNDLQNKEMVRGMNFKEGKLGTCDSCTQAKMVQNSFHSIDYHSIKEPLELIHIDLCGPMPVPSLGGSKYMFTLIDTFSRRIFVNFLHTKDEAYDTFVTFMNAVETSTGLKIKNVRSDNGTEFCNQRFIELFESKGIHHQLTVPYTPSSNGMAERANRTILEKVRTMLLDAELPMEFWAEAAAAAVHILNRLPCKAGDDRTPIERWRGEKPDVSYCKVFGSMAFYFVQPNYRNKLQPRSKKCIFVGYSLKRRAYRVYDVDKGEIIESRTVKFDENRKGSELLKTQENSLQQDVTDLLVYEKLSAHTEQDQNNPREIGNEPLSSSDEVSPTNEGDDATQEESETQEDSTQGISSREMARIQHQINLQEREEILQQQGVRRSERLKKKAQESHQASLSQSNKKDIPSNYKDAMESPNAVKWKEAMEVELNALDKHNVWKLVPRPRDQKVLRPKWIYTVKQVNGKEKYKARLVIMGMNQRPGVDYDESYAPVMKLETLRILLALSVQYGLKLKQYDIRTAYLYGTLEEDVYMEIPEGSKTNVGTDTVYKIEKSIYGLPQSALRWNLKLNEELTGIGFMRLDTEPCVYSYQRGHHFILLGVYVDDLLVLGTSDEIINEVMAKVGEKFELGEIEGDNIFLGINIKRNGNEMTLDQTSYIKKILERFDMDQATAVATPFDYNQKPDVYEDSPKVDQKLYQEMLGSLSYVSVATRPDISYGVSRLSQFSKDPRGIHLNAVKRIFKYLKGTQNCGLTFVRGSENITIEADASWSTTSEAKSISGYIVKMGNNVIAWKSQKQDTVALSTCEAELISLCEATREACWMQEFLRELEMDEYIRTPITVKTDSSAACQWIQRKEVSARTKHIQRKYYFIKDKVEEKKINIELIRSEEMTADVLTKGLPEKQHKLCVSKMGLSFNKAKG